VGVPPALDGARLAATAPTPRTAELRGEKRGPAPPTRFQRVWERLGREVDRGEAIVGSAARATFGRMDAGTLIALQAGIYRYSEAVDLTVKLVDRASTAVKTILESGR
jgi:hypothetical protein